MKSPIDKLTPEERLAHDALAAQLADEGRILEAGFRAMRVAIIPKSASEQQVFDMRTAYFAGAQHLFSVLLATIGGSPEEEAKDYRRISLVGEELAEFAADLRLRLELPGGSA